MGIGKSKVGRMSAGARRVIGATAKPLYPIDGKAAGLDRRNPQDLPLRGRGPARSGGRSSSPVGARIARPFVPDVITTTLREVARRVIGATAKPLYPIDGKAAGLDRRNPKTSLFEGGGPPQRWKESVPDVITTTLREDARRVIGATAKPLYPIDGKAGGLDRRNPLNPRQGLKQVHFILLA